MTQVDLRLVRGDVHEVGSTRWASGTLGTHTRARAPLFGASREGTFCLVTSTFGHGVAPTCCSWPKRLVSQLGDSVDYPHAHYCSLATDVGRRESDTTARHRNPLS